MLKEGSHADFIMQAVGAGISKDQVKELIRVSEENDKLFQAAIKTQEEMGKGKPFMTREEVEIHDEMTSLYRRSFHMGRWENAFDEARFRELDRRLRCLKIHRESTADYNIQSEIYSTLKPKDKLTVHYLYEEGEEMNSEENEKEVTNYLNVEVKKLDSGYTYEISIGEKYERLEKGKHAVTTKKQLLSKITKLVESLD